MEDNTEELAQAIICSLCDQLIDEGDERTFGDGSIACENCTIWCEDCNILVVSDESVTDGYNYYCNSCGKYCERCNNAFSGDDYFVSGESWCENCYESHTFYCEPCGESYSDREDYYHVEDNTWCDNCTSRYAWYCEDCDQYNREDNECGNCEATQGGNSTIAGRECNCRKVIHEYNCKPPLVFHGESKSGLYLGLELETQIRGGSLDGAAEYATNALLENKVGIIKHDGSIGRDVYDGFEIVTQPHTHLQYREHSDTLWNIINTLRLDYGARSWDTKTCGIHIHVSRAGFSSGACIPMRNI